jgi:hypothetical protein
MKWKMGRSAFLSLLCALQIGVLGSVAYAEEGQSASGVTITEFALLDKKFDKTGSAEFKPDGSKDGHYEVSVNFPEKTVVNAVVLRSTDVFGKENYQGIWRTNRVGVGWLLGIVHGGKVITPAFRPSPNDPVGTFEGSVSFELYANDNRTIKEGQYYVLEIETPDDTIYSQPITFGKPMNGGDSTGSPTPNPSPNPAPNPTPAPNPGQVTELMITGGPGSITVQGATPGAMITLLQNYVSYEQKAVYNHGSKFADSKGSTHFTKLPSGSQYYVMETVNGQKSRTSAETTVTTEKTADLIKEEEISAWVLLDRGATPSQLKLTVRGVVANSEIKMVGVSYAGVYANVPVNAEGIFRIDKTYDIFSPIDFVTVTATASNGKKHVIHNKLGIVDFFDDTSVKAVRNGNDLVIQANKGIASAENYQVYLIDGNKLIPLVEQEKPAPGTYKGVVTTEKALQDIRLLVKAGLSVEIVSIMP